MAGHLHVVSWKRPGGRATSKPLLVLMPLLVVMMHDAVVLGAARQQMGSSQPSSTDPRRKCHEIPICAAAAKGDAELLRTVLTSAPDLEETNYQGWTALHFASHKNKSRTVTMLISAGADLSARVGESGGLATALHLAAARDAAPVIRVLLGSGMNPEARQEGGATALHIAAGGGHWRATEALLEGGANIEATDDDGWTPLHGAALTGHILSTAALLRSDASLHAKNNEGKTPYDLHLDEDGDPDDPDFGEMIKTWLHHLPQGKHAATAAIQNVCDESLKLFEEQVTEAKRKRAAKDAELPANMRKENDKLRAQMDADYEAAPHRKTEL